MSNCLSLKLNHIDQLQQHEWDAFIAKVIRPFESFCYQHAIISVDDLYQEGWIGLIKASERYDPAKSKFTTFAFLYIRYYIMNYIKYTTNKDCDLAEIETLDQGEYHEDSNKDFYHTIETVLGNEKHFDLIYKHFYEYKSLRGIAKEQGVSCELISKRLKKLLEKASKRLSHENY